MQHRAARTCREEPNKDPPTAAARAAVSRQLEKRNSRARRRHGDAAGARPSSHEGINLSPLEEEDGGGGEANGGPSPPRPREARLATDGSSLAVTSRSQAAD
ncbi:unnamed protein product [Urochloa humidicola]